MVEKMDNVLKKAVESGIEEYMKEKAGEFRPKRTKDDVIEKEKKVIKLESRLGSLLSRIRNNSNSGHIKKSTKLKHIHLKWQRFDPVKEKYCTVKLNEGGGHRFIEWAYKEPLLFSELQSKAVELYFDNDGVNFFHENSTECFINICDASGIALPHDQNLWDYLEKKGLFVSKVSFVLQSKDTAYIPNCSSAKICDVCHCTMIGSECLMCEQNLEFRNSIASDQQQLNTHSTISDSPLDYNEIPHFPVLEDDHPDIDNVIPSLHALEDDHPSIDELRQQRLQHFVQIQDDISPIPVASSPSEHQIVIHRMNLKGDLMAEFQKQKVQATDTVTFKVIDPRGNPEVGVGSGVQREMYSCFWHEIKDCYMIGEKERVPVVRHDLFKTEWKTIGFILVKGYVDTQYFPTFLSKAFVQYCLNKKVSSEQLTESFMNFLSNDEAETLKKALSAPEGDEIFTSDELLDILDQFHCRSQVTKCNISLVVSELAQQELIQKPFLMTACWEEPFKILKGKPSFQSLEAIDKLYADLTPTIKKVIALFKASPTSDGERDSFNYLKRFIRGLDISQVQKLLKFLTGSDMIIVEEIAVEFYKPGSDISRRPIAHTCAPCLELPSTYNNFCELREEFVNILIANTWDMDIV